MTAFAFKVPIKPIGKARPRMKRIAGGKMVTYTPGPTQRAEAQIRAFALQARVQPLAGPVRLTVHVYLERPKSHTRAQRAVPYVVSVPDWDNYGKLASDALNKIAWFDDSQVAIGAVEKWYAQAGEDERWEILVEELLPAEVAA